MTASLTHAVDLSAFEAEFQKPCAGRRCDHPATHAVWISHTKRIGHGVMVHSCADCLGVTINNWARMLKGKFFCTSCGTPLTGQLSDHLRYVEL